MKKVMVIGCCGAGKSTFSKQLAKQTALPLYHLDQYYWKANWTETKTSEWEPIVEKLASKPSWIIDGNYGGTMDIRIKEADTIIYLDRSTLVCLWRIIKRTIKYHGTERPDMPIGCKERFDWAFLHYVTIFNLTRRKSILSKIKSSHTSAQIHILRSDNATEEYLRKQSKQHALSYNG